MNQEVLAPIVAGGGALVVAVLAYLTAVVQSNTRAIASHAQQIAARPAQPPPRSPRSTDAGGGGVAVRQAPRWDQLHDPLPDGSLAPQRWQECGEECCAMEISRQHGVPLSADALRALLGGPGRVALTSATDLVRCLALCNVPAAAEAVDDLGIAARLQAITKAGGTAICLGTWVSPSVQHWILVTRADAGGCGANDPWEGRRRVWTWAAFRESYAGEIVASTRTPDPIEQRS